MIAAFASLPVFFAVFWKSGVALGAALCVSRLLRRQSADLRRLVLSTAVVAMFVAAAALPVLPRWTAAMPAAAAVPEQAPAPAIINDNELAASDTPLKAAQPLVRRIDFRPWLLPLIWFAGAATLLMRFAINLHALRRLRKASEAVTDAALPRPVRLWRNDAVGAPVTWGIVRPIILVPAGFEKLPAECRDAVLCHELAHIQAHDFLMRCLAEVARALLWFQPLMWIVWRQLREEQELACDNRVLATGRKPSAYAKLLLDWESSPGVDSLIAVGIANRSSLKRRLYALLDPDLRRDSVQCAGAAGVWLLALALALPLAAISFTQDPPAQAAAAQPPSAPKPKFDAASIKPCQPGDGPGRGGGVVGANAGVNPNLPEGFGGYFRASPGRLDVTCGSVMTMVNFAYAEHGEALLNNSTLPGREGERIKGVPKWALAARYTIHAETDDPVANGPTMIGRGATAGRTPASALLYGPMLQSLLEERFQLKLRRVIDQVPMYALTVAKGGLKLKPMKAGECIPIENGRLRRVGPGDKPYCGNVQEPSNGPNRTFLAGGITLERLARTLSNMVLDRYVIDRTGITESFNIRLEYAPDENTRCFGPAQYCAVDPSSDIPPGPAIFAALEQQLGLKLEPIKGPREHIVIDSVERPSEN